MFLGWLIMLEIYHQYSLAIELLNRRARVSIIHRETGIPKELLRKTYNELHGCSPSRGAVKYSTQGLTRNNKNYLEVTLFAVCFAKVDSISQESCIKKIIQAFDIYKQIIPTGQLSFSAAWVIAKDIALRAIELRPCNHCGAPVLLNARENGIDRCGVCRTKFNQ